MLRTFGTAALAVGLLFLTGISRADQSSRKHDELVKQVWARLLMVAEPVRGLEWPPTCSISDEDQINAYATVEVQLTPVDKAKQSFKLQVCPKVVVFRGMLDRIIRTESDKDKEAAADRLAYVLGHELAHILLLHIKRDPTEKTPLVRRVFGREQEIAADVEGAKLALKAGFSLRRGMEAIRRMQKQGLEYSSFEGLQADHPSWNDRLVHLDKNQAGLWKAMSAFENGTFFLLTEQFLSAELCFRQVTREFPKCHEAWTNLGYALLMQYCDSLDTEDLRRFQIGQLLIGGFYRRPQSLEAETRGIQSKLWEQAVACLRKSLQLKPDQVLAKANLGVAYLVHADGKPDVAQATRYLREAAKRAQGENSLDPLTRAAILVNAGVADMAGRRTEESVRKFAQGEMLGSRLFGGAGRLPVHTSLSSALLYNRAVLLTANPDKEKQQQAVGQWEQYLAAASSAGAWWPLAYERYSELCKKLSRAPKSKKDLAKDQIPSRRLVTSVTLASGVTLAVSEPITEAVQRLGEKAPLFARTKLTRLSYPKHGIEVLATDRVLAIHLVGDKAPPLPIRAEGLGGQAKELRLNMPEAELNAILGDEAFDNRPLDDLKVIYRFYPSLGLAVRIQDKKAVEMVVAQIPRKRLGE